MEYRDRQLGHGVVSQLPVLLHRRQRFMVLILVAVYLADRAATWVVVGLGGDDVLVSVFGPYSSVMVTGSELANSCHCPEVVVCPWGVSLCPSLGGHTVSDTPRGLV